MARKTPRIAGNPPISPQDDEIDEKPYPVDQDESGEDMEIIENEDGSAIVPEIAGIPKRGVDFFENLAESLPEAELVSLASDLVELVEKDCDARKKRDEQYQDGLRRTGLGDDAPGGASFDGASKVVHPVLAEATVDFAARAIKELFPPDGPVKTDIVGDAAPDALDRAERKRMYMNWQLTRQMREYRSELETLLTQLPMGGSQFQKFWYDERLQRPVSEFVPIDDIFLPFAATSFYTSPRMTHVLHLTRFEYKKRVKSGLYREIDAVEGNSPFPDTTDTAEANAKIEGKEEDAYNEDGVRDFYEIYCYERLDDPLTDGDSAPYIITIDAYSDKIVSIYRNWEENDPTLEKLDWFVEWKFIPWRGAYAIGFPHLIGGLAAALTGALRALLDSAHINNAPSLLKLKGGRATGQDIQIDIAQVTEIDAPPGVNSVKDVVMGLPYNPPSPVLFQLLGFLTDAAKGVVNTANENIQNVGDRTPVGTTQSLIEQGSMTYSAIHARLHESQMKALEILHRLNAQWLDERVEISDLGKLVVGKQDFIGSLDIIPVSDPAIFSEAQRYAQTQALVQMSQDPSVPWNKVAIYRRAMKQMRIPGADEFLPPPKNPVTADPVSENVAAMQGSPLKADPKQDHMAHLQAHLGFISSPINQLDQDPNPNLQNLMNHCKEHLLFLYQTDVQQGIQMVQQQQQMQQQADLQQALAAQQSLEMQGIRPANPLQQSIQGGLQ